jgi:imidazoleglycerol-phosphate dehydratase/histidinol-phosphatase
MSSRVLFIDRDGTLIREPDDHQVDALDKVALVNGVVPALLQLQRHGFEFVMVSNQDGLGTPSFPSDKFERCHAHMLAIFESQGIVFSESFICPHLPEDRCHCRKPAAGLLTKFLAANAIDLGHSAVIGDRESDMELAQCIGVQGLLLDELGKFENTWPGIVESLCFGKRQARATRKTSETDISVAVNLDAPGRISAVTGIGFFDHMLEQLAKHGGFSIDLRCAGDLQIDEHHTVEDVAICLGKALREALGNKLGIARYGQALPMDESLAQTAIDLSGRGALVFTAEFPRERVGQFPVEMVEHFFLTLADTLGAAIHIRIDGQNTHHMIEACFKSVGRCLQQAIRIDGADLPSTKGTLA